MNSSAFPRASVPKVRHRVSRFVLAVALGLISIPSLHAQVSAAAKKEMADIVALKKTFTPAEQKMSFNLVLASRAAQHKPLGKFARYLGVNSRNSRGEMAVEITGHMSPSLMSSPAMAGVDRVDGNIPQQAFTSGHVRAHVSAARLLELASHADVTSIRESSFAHTNVGSVTSQGYIAHRANQAVALGVNGAGVRVGVLSDSASPARVAALIASGDLPADTVVLPGQAGEGEDEGTAMMEIVHDMAPGAKLFFATAFTSEDSFAENIRTLRFTYHCDIIVDDISYFDEPVFQDGIIAQAVNDITADGGLYFSSAANSGNLSSGTSGTWEGDFRPLGTSGLNSFNGAPYDTLTSLASSGVWLQWSDPIGGSSNDYDLFILDSTGTVVKGASISAQTGTQDPLEYVYPSDTCGTATATGYCPAVGDLIVVQLYSGATRALHIDTERATVTVGTSGATFGHNAGQSTVSMAATYWNSARTGTKPFTGVANPVETFSSDGPRKIFYQPDGTPITPGRFTFARNGGATLTKPDATAADGVFTKTPGFLPFFGTSAAAPHAAGIAALVKSANPGLTNVQIHQILTSTTLDNMAPGTDRDSGYGILMALPAVQAAQATH